MPESEWDLDWDNDFGHPAPAPPDWILLDATDLTPKEVRGP